MDFILWIIIAYYLGSPILIKFTNWHKRFPEFEPINIYSMPDHLIEFFSKVGESLKKVDFIPIAYFYSQGQAPNVSCYLSLWANPYTKDTAVVADLSANNGFVNIRSPFLAFSTDFEDGTEVVTTNSPHPPIFKKNPNKTETRIPDLYDANLLYSIHQKMVEGLNKRGEKVLPPPGNENFYLSLSIVKELEYQEKAGLYFLDYETGKYRPTWRGAYLMTWKLIWPVKPILQAILKYRAKKIVRLLGKP